MPLYEIDYGNRKDPWIRLIHQGSEKRFYANYAGEFFRSRRRPVTVQVGTRTRRRQRFNVSVSGNIWPEDVRVHGVREPDPRNLRMLRIIGMDIPNEV